MDMRKVRVTRVRLTRQFPEQAMQAKPTVKALADLAAKVESRANSLAASEGVELDTSLESGLRPKGRPFTNVVSTNAAQEWGNRYVERRRILGRTAEEFGTKKGGSA